MSARRSSSKRRTLQTVEREHNAVYAKVRSLLDETGRLQKELETFPAWREKMAAHAVRADRRRKADDRAADRKREKERDRKRAERPDNAFFVDSYGSGPGCDDETSLHFIISGLDYINACEYPHEMTDDAELGRNLIIQNMVYALRAVAKSLKDEREAKAKEAQS